MKVVKAYWWCKSRVLTTTEGLTYSNHNMCSVCTFWSIEAATAGGVIISASMMNASL